jgi:single-stranded-DNA-specific exonuclease
MRVAGLRKNPQPETIGYVLGPRLNASGRLAEARAGWELLVTGNLSRARQIAQELDDLNKQRQNLEREATEQVFAGLFEHFDPASHGCIIAASNHWHQGVIGIVAAKLLREYYCPTIIISIDENGKGKGSARSIEGCSIMDALRDCREHLLGFGGHAQAAGLEIEAARIPAFREALNAWMRENIPSDTYQERLKIDLVLDEHHLTEALAVEIARMQPFGRSNPPPLVAIHRLSIMGTPKLFGKNHVRFRAACGHLLFDTVAFNLADQLPQSTGFSIAGYWEMDLFTSRPCFRAVDWREAA